MKAPILLLPLLLLAACGRPAGAEVTVTDAWCRATAPGAPSAGCYVTLRARAADRLTAVETPAADRAEIHEMDMSGGIMRMRALKDGLALPAGKAVTLAPGGLHLMLIGPKTPLAEGGAVPLVLRFETAPAQTVSAPVRSGAGGRP